nr:hypothetical protein CFP56_32375 [Quercus suber]
MHGRLRGSRRGAAGGRRDLSKGFACPVRSPTHRTAAKSHSRRVHGRDDVIDDRSYVLCTINSKVSCLASALGPSSLRMELDAKDGVKYLPRLRSSCYLEYRIDQTLAASSADLDLQSPRTACCALPVLGGELISLGAVNLFRAASNLGTGLASGLG